MSKRTPLSTKGIWNTQNAEIWTPMKSLQQLLDNLYYQQISILPYTRLIERKIASNIKKKKRNARNLIYKAI